MSDAEEIKHEVEDLHNLAEDIVHKAAAEAAEIVAEGRVKAIQDSLRIFYKENRVKALIVIVLICTIINLAIILPLTLALVSQEADTAKNTARAVASSAQTYRVELCRKLKSSVNVQINANKKQQAESDVIFSNLEKKGEGAFGLTPKQLKKALAAGKALQKHQLDQLYSIASSNCK